MAFSSLPLELTDRILSYVVPWKWNAEWAVETSFYRVDDATFIEPFGYMRHNLCALRLVSRQFCATMSRELLRKADGDELRRDMGGMNIDSLAALCLTKYDMGPRHRALPLRRAAALASAFCRWKEARNESFHEVDYLKAVFSAMLANKGIGWAYIELKLSEDAHGVSAPVQPEMDAGGDAERELLENGGLSVAAFLGDLSTIKALLENGADPNKPQDLYGSPVYAAAYSGHADAMRLLVDAGADVSLGEGAIGLPLEAAACNGHLGAVQLLVEQNVTIGRALNYALLGGHEAMACFFLSQTDKVDVNATTDYNTPWTPISTAIMANCRKAALQLCTYPNLEPNGLDREETAPLYEAVRRQWTDVVWALISLPATQVNGRGPASNPLLLACEEGYDDSVRLLLLRHDIDVNVRGAADMRPLDYAIRAGHRSIVRLLLKHPGVRADGDGVLGRSPLEVAIAEEDLEIIELLIKRPEILASELEGAHAMFAAVDVGSLPVLRRLLDVFSLNLDIVNDDEQNIIGAAIVNGCPGMAELLLALVNADPDYCAHRDVPFLCLAAREGRLDVVQYLLSQDDVDADVMSDFGSPLQCAIVWQHIEVVRCLLQRDDVDANIGTPDAIYFAPEADSFLEKNAEDPSYVSKYAEKLRNEVGGQSTPLLNALRFSSRAIVELLLDHSDIDPNGQDSYDRTPLSFAVTGPVRGCSCVDMVQLLLAHPDTDPNIVDEEGWSPLLLAVDRGDLAIVDLLLQHSDTDPNLANKKGDTPLLLADRYGRQELVELLLEHSERNGLSDSP